MGTSQSAVFLGVDLGWYGKPSGLASLEIRGSGLRLRSMTRMQDSSEILNWVQAESGQSTTVVGVDAPLVIANEAGIRDAERELNGEFRRFHAGCHAANLGRPFARNVLAFSSRLSALGFAHGGAMAARQEGRFQIEVHPHAATVSLFDLPLIVKYKRGLREAKARGLRHLRTLMQTRLPLLDPALAVRLPSIPLRGNLKPVEDQIDAVLCAYIAAYWWYWAAARNHAFGSNEKGYIVVPRRRTDGVG